MSNKRIAEGAGGGVYGVGFIVALVYFIQHTSDFATGFLGFVKALIWPGILIYKLFEFLKI